MKFPNELTIFPWSLWCAVLAIKAMKHRVLKVLLICHQSNPLSCPRHYIIRRPKLDASLYTHSCLQSSQTLAEWSWKGDGMGCWPRGIRGEKNGLRGLFNNCDFLGGVRCVRTVLITVLQRRHDDFEWPEGERKKNQNLCEWPQESIYLYGVCLDESIHCHSRIVSIVSVAALVWLRDAESEMLSLHCPAQQPIAHSAGL